MQRSKGFTGLEIIGIVVAAALLVGAIAGAIHLVTSYLDGVRKEAFEAGEAKCDAAYKARDNQQLADVQRQLIAAMKAKEVAEKRANDLARQLGAKLKQEQETTDADAKRTLADLASGALILRDGIVQPVACPAVDSADAAGGAAGSGPGAARKACYRLSSEAERAVVETAARSDKYALQVIALQEQAARDRETCKASSP